MTKPRRMTKPVTAAGHTITIADRPPRAWFDEPAERPEIGGLAVTDDGRVYGYLAPAGVAHRGYRKRVEVPMRNVDYSRFMNRATILEDGSRLATGVLTLECGHADLSSGAGAAATHYENSCSVVATVRVGENRRGVWVAGALLPDVTADMVNRMMACQLSGDWRPHQEHRGKRELTAALLVPVPGFAMAASAGRLASASAGDVDARLADVARTVANRMRDEIKAIPTRDQLVVAAGRMRDELDRDKLARLKREVDAPRIAAWREAFLNDPLAAARAEANAMACEVRELTDPSYRAMVASARRYRVKREAAQWRRALVAGCLLPGAGDLSRRYDKGARLETGLRAAVMAGDETAAPLLASVVARRGRDTNRAITASGYAPSWKVTQTRDGHSKATWTRFHPDGRITTHERFKFRGSGEWLTGRQFAERQHRARQRDRQIRRQIPAVGRPQRRR